MPLPVTFANLPTGNNPASLLDQQYAAVAAMGTTFCTATGSNAILLTVQPNQPNPTSYVSGQRFNFIAAANNTGAVTAQVGSLAALPVYNGGVALLANAIVGGVTCELVTNLTESGFDLTSGGGFLPTGGGNVSGPVTLSYPNAQLTLSSAAGTARAIFGSSGGGLTGNRWSIVLGSSTAEGGGNTGSDFNINRYADGTGAFIDTPLAITRSTGIVTIAPNGLQVIGPTCSIGNGTAATSMVFNKGTGAISNAIAGQRTGTPRWTLYLGNPTTEPGSGNVGSDLQISRFADAGGFLDNPILTARSNGQTTFSIAIVNGPSDRTLKENIAPIDGALDKVKALQGVSFNMKATPEKKEIGLIAQDVEPVVPEIIQEFKTADAEGKEGEPKLALDYPKLVAVLIEAIKTLSARVEKLEAR